MHLFVTSPPPAPGLRDVHAGPPIPTAADREADRDRQRGIRANSEQGIDSCGTLSYNVLHETPNTEG